MSIEVNSSSSTFYFYRMNVDRLAFLENEKTPWLFTSQNLKDLTEITPSVKTRLSMISLIGPRLLDPRAKVDYFIGLFRFSEEKEKVQEILKTRTHVLASSLFRQSGLSLQPMGGGYTEGENSAPRPVIAIPGLAKARAKVTKPLVKLQIKSPGGELPSFAKPTVPPGRGTPLEKVPEFGQSPNRALVKTPLEKINESKSASPPRFQPKSITIEKAPRPRSRSPSPKSVRKEEAVVEVASPPTPTKVPTPVSPPAPITPLLTPALPPTPVMQPTPPVVTAAVTPVAPSTPTVIVVPPTAPAAVITAPIIPSPAAVVVPLTPEIKPVSILKSAIKAPTAPTAKPTPSGPVVNEGVIKMGNMAYNLGPRKNKNAPPAAAPPKVEIVNPPPAIISNEIHTISDDSDSDYHSEGTVPESRNETITVITPTPTPTPTPAPTPVQQTIDIVHASPVVDVQTIPKSPPLKPKTISKMLSNIGRKFITKSSSNYSNGNSPAAPTQNRDSNSNTQPQGGNVPAPVVSVPVLGGNAVSGGGNGAPFGGYTMTDVDRETRMQAQMNSSFQDSGFTVSRRDESLQSPFKSNLPSPLASPVHSTTMCLPPSMVSPISIMTQAQENGQNGAVVKPPKKSVRMASPERPEAATSRERNTRSMSSMDALPPRADICSPDRVVNKNNAWRKSTRWEVSVRSIASDFGTTRSIDKAMERGLTQQKKRNQTPDRRQQLPRTEEKHNEDEEDEDEEEYTEEEKDQQEEPAPPPRVVRRPTSPDANGHSRRRSSNDSLPDKSSSVTGVFTSPIEITTFREVSYYKGMPVEGPIETGQDGTPLFRYQELVRRNVMRSYDGVDHSNLEIHLTDTDFQKVFGMSKVTNRTHTQCHPFKKFFNTPCAH